MHMKFWCTYLLESDHLEGQDKV